MEQFLEFVTRHPYLVASFVLVLGLLIFSELRRRSYGGNDISPLQATQFLNHENAILVDVREDKEFAEGHIVDALHIPLGKLNDESKTLNKHRKKSIIAYCRTGHRSAAACARLRKQGFDSVYNLRGGVTAWQRDNLPLTRD